MHTNPTAQRLVEAAERVICGAAHANAVTSRAIAAAAGANLSAIAYHFGSLDGLIAATATQVYRRLNTERLNLLQRAVDRHRPAPPPVAEVIEALIGPSVRWSLNPASPYPVFDYISRLNALSPRPELYRPMAEEVGAHRAFIAVLRRAAPWLSAADVGWRINAALGIRSQVNRHRLRSAVLTEGAFDLDDPEVVIARMVEIIAPMFQRMAADHPAPRPLPRIRSAT